MLVPALRVRRACADGDARRPHENDQASIQVVAGGLENESGAAVALNEPGVGTPVVPTDTEVEIDGSLADERVVGGRLRSRGL